MKVQNIDLCNAGPCPEPYFPRSGLMRVTRRVFRLPVIDNQLQLREGKPIGVSSYWHKTLITLIASLLQ